MDIKVLQKLQEWAVTMPLPVLLIIAILLALGAVRFLHPVSKSLRKDKEGRTMPRIVSGVFALACVLFLGLVGTARCGHAPAEPSEKREKEAPEPVASTQKPDPPMVGSIGTVNGPLQIGGTGSVITQNIVAPSGASSAQPTLPGVTNFNCPGCTIIYGLPPQTDVGAVKEAVRVDAGSRRPPVDPYATAHPGFEFVMSLVFGHPIQGRDNFIFDFGLPDRATRRVSLYVGQERSLHFRIIDAHAKEHTVVVPQSVRKGFRFDSAMLLICQYAIIGRRSFLRVLINGTEAGSTPEKSPRDLDHLDMDSADLIYGTDLRDENGGVFAITEMIYYLSSTVGSIGNDNLLSRFDLLLDAGQPFIVFSGTGGLGHRHGVVADAGK